MSEYHTQHTAVREGIKQLTWLLEQIANANVPAEIRPLLFDSKRVAPEKDSQHQLSIAKLEAEAAAAAKRKCILATLGRGMGGAPFSWCSPQRVVEFYHQLHWQATQLPVLG